MKIYEHKLYIHTFNTYNKLLIINKVIFYIFKKDVFLLWKNYIMVVFMKKVEDM